MSTAAADGASLAGRLLLALPGMPDPRFARAVIALCVHDGAGALGIGVGEELPGITLHALLADLDIAPGVAPDCALLAGGPVEPHRGFVLHSPDWAGEGTLAACTAWSLSASREVLAAIAGGTGPARWLVALGYAGWDAGQLDGEMQRHGWHAAAAHGDLIFAQDAKARWHAAWQAEGIDPALLAPVTGRA